MDTQRRRTRLEGEVGGVDEIVNELLHFGSGQSVDVELLLRHLRRGLTARLKQAGWGFTGVPYDGRVVERRSRSFEISTHMSNLCDEETSVLLGFLSPLPESLQASLRFDVA